MLKFGYKLKHISIKIAFILLIIAQSSLLLSKTKQNLELSFKGIGKITLTSKKIQGVESSQLVLVNPGGLKQIIETFDGLIPNSIFKADLNFDNSYEFIITLKDTEGTEEIPIIYSIKNQIKKIYPVSDEENNKLISKKVFLTNFQKRNVLCTKNLVNYHDFGPPNLYRFNYFILQNGSLKKIHESFSVNNNFNLLMNRGAVYFHSGKYFKALEYYKQAISSSTGDISTPAKIECLFFQAESLKYVKDFKAALNIYQDIVINYAQNKRTNSAQREIELISSNLNNKKALSLWIDISNQINCENWLSASEMLDSINLPDASPRLNARILFMKAGVYVALNKIEEAVKTYHEICDKFPDLPIIDSVKVNLQDLEVKPEEADGL